VTTKVDPAHAKNMALQGKDANREWFRYTRHDITTGKVVSEFVHIPEDISEKENIARGKAAHEAGHVLITRMGEFVPADVMQQLGFQSLLAAAEERATDQVVRERYAGAGDWIDEARREGLPERGVELENAENEKLARIPRFMQLCSLIVYAPHYLAKAGNFPQYYDSQVVEIYNTLADEIDLIERSLPAEDSLEGEVLDKAIERYKIAYTRLWPAVQHLVDQDMQEETVRQILINASESDDKKRDLRKLLQEKDPLLTEEYNFILIMLSDNDDTLPKEEVDSQVGSEVGIDLPIISEELKQALLEILNNLPKDEVQVLVIMAEQSLKKSEDVIVNELGGKLVETPSETHREHETRMQAQTDLGPLGSEIVGSSGTADIMSSPQELEMEEIERRLASLQDNSLYNQTYNEIRDLDEELYVHLEEYFTPNLKRNVKLRGSGSRISLPAVFRWKAGRASGAKSIDNRIFETVRMPEKRDYSLTLLVDLSGSMSSGNKIHEAFKGTILLAEVLNRLGVANEILGFQDQVIVFKQFDEELTDMVRDRISGMVDEVSGINPGGHNHSGFNDDGPCLLDASLSLAQQNGREKILVVFSDGQPSGAHSDERDLVNAVSHITEQTDQKLIAIGLGTGTDHVKHYYPVSLPNVAVEQLAPTMAGLLEEIFTN